MCGIKGDSKAPIANPEKCINCACF
jgi:hypothetical protein